MSWMGYECTVICYDSGDDFEASSIRPLPSLDTLSKNSRASTVYADSVTGLYPFSSFQIDDQHGLGSCVYKRRNSSSRWSEEATHLYPIYEADEDAVEEDDDFSGSTPIARFFKSCLIQFAFIIDSS
ncbi:hypothetical protein KP509_08G037000 [Ceratopteris richardii]|uniref:Uncharacterized protein n=1 Tax=Ceratopteris richardii TaxID=49495 RepID=A0A8T2U944_CERRI|nr:hypothetical protein KP509_08G037000 [Ceratopteris richardii]